MKTEVYLTDFSGWAGLTCGSGTGPDKEPYLTPEGQRQAEFLASGLSEGRQEKIASLRFGKNRLQSLAAGVLLDYGLRRHGLMEREAGIRISSHGKQYSAVRPELKFSLSHSGTCALLALSDRECGCDIQKLAAADERIFRRFFAGEEAEYLCGIPEGRERDRAFAALWTRKESFVKLTGEGLSCPFSGFSVLHGFTPSGCAFFTWELPLYAVSACVELDGEIGLGSISVKKAGNSAEGYRLPGSPAAPVLKTVPWEVLVGAARKRKTYPFQNLADVVS